MQNQSALSHTGIGLGATTQTAIFQNVADQYSQVFFFSDVNN
jgi:hypothetical protein